MATWAFSSFRLIYQHKKVFLHALNCYLQKAFDLVCPLAISDSHAAWIDLNLPCFCFWFNFFPKAIADPDCLWGKYVRTAGGSEKRLKVIDKNNNILW